MFWRFRKLSYDILIPPLDKNICLLNEKEASDYFTWYMEKIPERLDYLTFVCSRELRISRDKLDCSPESLILLWKWFLRRAKTERVPRKERKKYKQIPGSVLSCNKQLTLETEYILRDIGMYFGETFRRNHPAICWTYYTKPRRDFFVNHPLLKGFVDRTFDRPFEAAFEPIHMAGVQASKILSNRSDDKDLYNIYLIWADKIDPIENMEEGFA